MSTRMHRIYQRASLLIFLLVFVACSSGGGGNPSEEPAAAVNVVGTVTGNGGIIDVTVSAAEVTSTTDATGHYQLNNVPVPGSGRLVLTFEKNGYATYQRNITVEANKTYAVAAKMTQFHFSEMVDPTVIQNLNIPNPNDPAGASLAMLDVPANAVSGSGSVSVNVAVGDPSTENGRAIFPGDYMASPDSNSEPDTELESVAFAEITIKDGDTEIETLNTPADLSIKLPDEFQTGGSKAGTYDAADPDKDSIEWWSYNEDNGSWIREDADPSTPDVIDDAAVIDVGGVLYAKAKVTHFSWWNADRPVTQHACLCVRVVDDQGNPMQGVMVIAEGVTYNGRSTPVMTNAEGIACVNVKRSTATEVEKVQVYVEQGGAKFLYNITDAAEGDVISNEIVTPTLQGSTLDSSGECVTLGNDLSVAYDGTVTGTVTREGTGAPIAGFTIYSDFGETAITNASGVYSFAVPVGVNISLFAPGLINQNVNVPDTTPVEVDFVVPNLPPVIESYSRVPDGSVNVNTAVTINAMVSDPEEDAVTVAWATSAGTFNTTTGTSVVWTAPATSGTAFLTITATDSNGAETEEQVIIIVNTGFNVATNLNIIVKDNPVSDQPVTGAVVAFYNTDNRTIAANGVRTTGANGVADFGNVGRTTGTLTIAYQSTSEANSEYLIESYVDVPMGNIVYYTENELFINSSCPQPQTTSLNVGFTDIAAAATNVRLEPSYNSTTVTTPTITMGICPNIVQTDGTVSLLATSYSTNSTTFEQQLYGYGYLLDQPVVNGANHSIPVNSGLTTVGYTTSPVTPMYISIMGERKGVEYTLGGTTGSMQTGAGNLLVPMEFPVDRYLIFASSANNNTGNIDKFILKIKQSLPLTEVINVHDNSISSLSYNAATNTVSWAMSGSAPVDFVDLYLTNYFDGINWSVFMPNNTTSWQVMELPTMPVNVDLNDLTNTFCELNLTLEDIDTMSGHADVWNNFTSSGDIFELLNQFNTTESNVDLGGPCQVIAAVSRSHAKVTTQDKSTREIQSTFGRSLNGLIRR